MISSFVDPISTPRTLLQTPGPYFSPGAGRRDVALKSLGSESVVPPSTKA